MHGLDHQIIEYSKKEKVMTDKQTDTQTEFPLVDSTPSVEGGEEKHILLNDSLTDNLKSRDASASKNVSIWIFFVIGE